jgi:DNA-binding transcriptional MerR regulator
MEQMGWTIDELAARVAAALDDAAYPGAPNGRVRDVPDARAIRWYATIGLVDRPSGMRGRTALYGPRHLVQIVAVKRLQAQGQRIADIQSVLAGAPDDVLTAIADIPGLQLDEPVPFEPRPRFWAQPPASAPAEKQPEFVHEQLSELQQRVAARRPVVRASGTLTGVHLNGTHLGGGAVLLLPTPPQPDDIDAIMTAAQPLLDVLADRGLLAE